MSILDFAQSLATTPTIIFGVLSIFGWGKSQPLTPDTPIDTEEIHSRLSRGIEDLMSADTRNLGLTIVSPQITLEDLQTAGRIRDLTQQE